MSSFALLEETPAEARPPSRAAPRAVAWSFYVFTAVLALWLFLYASGVFPWLGYAEGSSRHGVSGVRLSDDSGGGLSTMLLFKGQKAVWDYDVQVEGKDGVRLMVTSWTPSPDFVVKFEQIEASRRGRLEVAAPRTGLYSFRHELVPLGTLAGPAQPGSVRYRLTWGAR